MSDGAKYPNDMPTKYNRVIGWPGNPVQVTTSGTSAQSAALNNGTTYMVIASVEMRIARGSNPTASATSMRIPADTPFTFTVPVDGITYKMAAINVSAASGQLELTPMTGDRAGVIG